MSKFSRQLNLTDACSIPRANVSKTVAGMAHFAGTGPVGATCSRCKFWQKSGGQQKSGRKPKYICEKFRTMTGDAAKLIPGTSPACRHFEQQDGEHA